MAMAPRNPGNDDPALIDTERLANLLGAFEVSCRNRQELPAAVHEELELHIEQVVELFVRCCGSVPESHPQGTPAAEATCSKADRGRNDTQFAYLILGLPEKCSDKEDRTSNALLPWKRLLTWSRDGKPPLLYRWLISQKTIEQWAPQGPLVSLFRFLRSWCRTCAERGRKAKRRGDTSHDGGFHSSAEQPLSDTGGTDQRRERAQQHMGRGHQRQNRSAGPDKDPLMHFLAAVPLINDIIASGEEHQHPRVTQELKAQVGLVLFREVCKFPESRGLVDVGGITDFPIEGVPGTSLSAAIQALVEDHGLGPTKEDMPDADLDVILERQGKVTQARLLKTLGRLGGNWPSPSAFDKAVQRARDRAFSAIKEIGESLKELEELKEAEER